ncbi:MAG: thiamine pyrophosphate-dependent dehydrogenase E1 component subunit alpha [Chloroflexi bacterium]|nr:thiamine pyrophosphate-dependent dehydrogenase E1 component subunit alpha [Chloroflexota bacterium]OJV88900.1 MAG: pyruvate dehydrogenase (acetyl-transferring) E1 component subunit alpha [Chloroflexi bacterium 54-19]
MAKTNSLDAQTLISMYRTMAIIRNFEETMVNVYMEGKMPVFDIAGGTVPGEMHLAAGQEPVAVGVCAHLNDNDTVTAPHRAHHFAIAKGVDLKKMAAEIFGKDTGLGHGKGGHMHLFDQQKKFGCSGIIGAGMPVACGAALAAKKNGKDWVAVSFFGEGTANQGSFHESLNLAALWKLPVIFVCEDNSYAISVPKSKSTSIANNADRAASYGIPGFEIAENDVLAVYEAAREAVARARRGEGPSLMEVKTYRYLGHFQGDPELYRPKDEVAKLRESDPINKLGRQLIEQGAISEGDLVALDQEAAEKVKEAIEFARQSPYPQPADALKHVFV